MGTQPHPQYADTYQNRYPDPPSPSHSSDGHQYAHRNHHEGERRSADGADPPTGMNNNHYQNMDGGGGHPHNHGGGGHPHMNHGNGGGGHQHQQQMGGGGMPPPQMGGGMPPQVEPMSPVFMCLVTVCLIVTTYWWLQPILANWREIFGVEKKRENREDLRSMRKNLLASKNEETKQNVGGKVVAKDGTVNVQEVCTTHCNALKEHGVKLISEDNSLLSLNCLLSLIDNCLLKGYTSFPRTNDKLQRELLQFQEGETMLNLCGFFEQDPALHKLTTAPPTTAADKVKAAQDKINSKGMFVFDKSQRLQALVARQSIQFSLDISKTRGRAKWAAQFDPTILVPKDIEVVPREIMLLYANPAKLILENSVLRKMPVTEGAKSPEGSPREEDNGGGDEKTRIYGDYVLLERMSQKEKVLEATIRQGLFEDLYEDLEGEKRKEKDRNTLTTHSILQSAARVFSQRKRNAFRKATSQDRFRNQDIDSASRNPSKNSEDKSLNTKFFEDVLDHLLVPPGLELRYFLWDAPIPHAFGLSSSKGGKSEPTNDAAMNQIAKEAIPQWKISDMWSSKAEIRLVSQLVGIGGALDYTNDRYFVCCIVAGNPMYEFNAEAEQRRKEVLKRSLPNRGNADKYAFNPQNNQWNQMSFGAKVSTQDGKAEMKQKSGF